MKCTALLVMTLGIVFSGGCGPDGSGASSSTGAPAPAAPPSTGAVPEGRPPTGAVIDYPLTGSVFPPDFTRPSVLWHDDTPGVTVWSLTITFGDGGAPLATVSSGPPPTEGEIDPRAIGPTNELYVPTAYQSSAKIWTPSASQWAEIRRRSTNSPATLAIEGHSGDGSGEALSRAEVTFETSTDPVGAPIFYRDVPLMPSRGEGGKISPLDQNAVHLIAWRLRDVSRPDSKVVLTGMPTCANCHSFSRDGKTLGMDVDGPAGDKGTYAIAPLAEKTVIGDEEVITWNSFPDKPEGEKTIGFLSRISPDGSTVLSTVNEALYVNNFTNYKFLQVFYPTRGILAYYSKETGEMKALPGADDPRYVHCSPAWSPDGKWIVFSRARACDPDPEGHQRPTWAGDPNELPMRYDLYRMPFNGGRGGKPVAIAGASDNGMSNTFPKISPDGRWLVWTKCRNGLLMRPDGRLWILPIAGGEPREMNCNTALMNSWHSFSPNGRWMVFSSKVNTPYTQMFLTHLDEDGNDSPPILIPNSTAANRAVNIPEFVDRDFGSFNSIEVPAMKHFYELKDGMDLAQEGKYEEAIPILKRALETDPELIRTLVALGYAQLESGRIEEARETLIKATEVDPRSSLARVNLGLCFKRQGMLSLAADHFEMAASIDPTDRLAQHNLGLTRLELGDLKAALRALQIAAELDPRNPDVRNALGFVLKEQGRGDDAIAEYRAALRLAPDHPLALANLAVALLARGDLEEALAPLGGAIAADPENHALRRMLAETLLDLRRPAEALRVLDDALRAAPNDPNLAISTAWLLATLGDDSLRDGARAVQLAEQCLQATGEHAEVLDVLAAAYAEAGRFPDAIKAASRALELQESGAGTALPGLPERLESYRAGRPHRQ